MAHGTSRIDLHALFEPYLPGTERQAGKSETVRLDMTGTSHLLHDPAFIWWAVTIWFAERGRGYGEGEAKGSRRADCSKKGGPVPIRP